MKRPLILVVLALVSLATSTAQAGWWHHHHHHCCPVYQAAPAYYMPAYQPQVQMVQGQSGIGETLLIEMIRRLVPTPGTNPSPTNPVVRVETSELKQDLADIKASLKNLDARVENINSTVQAHGEAFGMIMTELKELRDKTPGGVKMKSKADLEKMINDDPNLRDKLNALFSGGTAEEKRESRDGVIDTMLKLMNK